MSIFAPIHTLKMTAEQYFQLGEDPPGTHLELIDGEIVVSPSPSRNHADIVFSLAYLLETHIRKQKLGKLYLDTDVVFSPPTARRPDIAFFGPAKLKQMPGDRLTAPPDLCVEVLSPSNEDDDRINKYNLYEIHGVPHYWIIDPEARTFECFELRNGKYAPAGTCREFETANLPPFADLAIALKELWLPGV